MQLQVTTIDLLFNYLCNDLHKRNLSVLILGDFKATLLFGWVEII